MDCFGDFCLSCDKQTNGTSFCSQVCRLAEMDTTPLSEPSSPLYTDSKAAQRRSIGVVPTRIELPPAIDFSLYRQSSSTASSPRSSMGSLSRSPSQTSLTLTETSQSIYDRRLSEQVRKDLNSYAGYFDQTRTLRRRKSLQ